MDFLELMQKRYTTKYYDENKNISDEVLNKILECLRLTPSSVNMQGWKFFLMDRESKKQIREALPDFNVQRFDSCANVLVLTAKTSIDKEYALKVAKKQHEDGRLSEAKIEACADGCMAFVKEHDAEIGVLNWNARQTYIAMATVLYAAQSYGVDSTAVEGADFKKIDELMGLKEQGLAAISLIFLGYRAAKDSNTLDKRPKSRLYFDDVIVRV